MCLTPAVVRREGEVLVEVLDIRLAEQRICRYRKIPFSILVVVLRLFNIGSQTPSKRHRRPNRMLGYVTVRLSWIRLCSKKDRELPLLDTVDRVEIG